MNFLNVILFMMLASFGYSQELNSGKLRDVNDPTELTTENLKGTYQVILKDERMIEPEITSGLLYLIAESRLENEENTITIDQYTSIRIPSYATIQSGKFVPLQKYSYE